MKSVLSQPPHHHAPASVVLLLRDRLDLHGLEDRLVEGRQPTGRSDLPASLDRVQQEVGLSGDCRGTVRGGGLR